jgi:bifunctional non-homologous end joining protein LigD
MRSRARATRTHHPARTQLARARRTARAKAPVPVALPAGVDDVLVRVDDRMLRLTNLRKIFFPRLGLTKADLLRYYATMAPVLLPHLRDRAMVMRRYPDGAEGASFFMKRAPAPRPDWIAICSIEHASGNVIDFPVVQDTASLLWLVNLGCIDLNQWYARCDDVDRPDALHFDLDPGPEVGFAQVREAALRLRDALGELNVTAYAKTSGSKGIHVYVPIVRGPNQREVWALSKEIARAAAARHARVLTAEYRIARRPRDRVLVDYNQNAWGRTLASVYSVRPRPEASVSTPVGWDEVEAGVGIADFRIDNVPDRVRRRGDLWAPLLASRGRARLAWRV